MSDELREALDDLFTALYLRQYMKRKGNDTQAIKAATEKICELQDEIKLLKRERNDLNWRDKPERFRR
jgi:phosphosulfolactate phosphohydrolase-like enzyme